MSDIKARIDDYLNNGDLFSPELLYHKAVSDLLIDCRKRITKLEEQMADFCNTYDECIDEGVDVNTDYFNEMFRKALRRGR